MTCGVVEDSGLLEFDAVFIVNQLLIFRRNLWPLSSGSKLYKSLLSSKRLPIPLKGNYCRNQHSELFR